MNQYSKLVGRITQTLAVAGMVVALGSPAAQAAVQGKGGGNGKGGGGGGGGGGNPTHVLHLLGSLAGPIGNAGALRINEAGAFAGSSVTPSGDTHAFLLVPRDTDGDGIADTWNLDDDGDGINDLMIDLGALGGTYSQGLSVNEFEQVVGSVRDADGVERAFVWEDLNGNGQSDLGEMQIVSTPTGIDAEAYGINDAGQIAFFESTTSYVLTGRDTDGDGKADLWYEDFDGDGVNDLLHELGTLAATPNAGSRVVDINQSGVVCGTTTFSGGGSTAFAIFPEDLDGDGLADNWNHDDNGDGINDLMIDLGRPDGYERATAISLNDMGQFVGRAQPTQKKKFSVKLDAFFWEVDAAGVVTRIALGKLKGDSLVSAQNINNASMITGISGVFAEDGTGFFMSSPTATMVDMVQVVTDAGGLKQLKAQAINDLGMITGWIDDAGLQGAYIAIPISTSN